MKKLMTSVLCSAMLALSCKKENEPTTQNQFAMPNFATSKYPFLQDVKDVQPFEISSITVKGKSVATEEPSRVKLRFRWDGCERPLGICVRIPLSVARSANNSNDQTIGNAIVKVADGKVYLKPDKRIYFSNGTAPITQDIDLGSDIASRFGYTSVIIKKGLYKMRFDNDKLNGEIYLDALTK